MPRMPRRDAPGALHHVTLRGVGQCDVFVDDEDRAFLFDRISVVGGECGASILAFAFMSNHVHLVIETGPTALSKLMQRITTAYALYFNRRHGRVGHLFQNRYGAKPIRGEAHLRNAILYVHANPLEARIVPDAPALERYRWAGHASLVGTEVPGFLDIPAALSVFADGAEQARAELRQRMQDWKPDDEPPKALEPLLLPQLECAITACAAKYGVAAEQIAGGGRGREVCRARAEVAHQAIALHELPAREVALRLGITHAAALRAAARGAPPSLAPKSPARMNVPATSPCASARALRRGVR
jgi:REP element-mobilizing transposase RayT